MKLYKEDLTNVGHFHDNFEGGFLALSSPMDVPNFERILIREILLEFGDFKIVDEFENDGFWVSVTNLPYSEYEKIKKSI